MVPVEVVAGATGCRRWSAGSDWLNECTWDGGSGAGSCDGRKGGDVVAGGQDLFLGTPFFLERELNVYSGDDGGSGGGSSDDDGSSGGGDGSIGSDGGDGGSSDDDSSSGGGDGSSGGGESSGGSSNGCSGGGGGKWEQYW